MKKVTGFHLQYRRETDRKKRGREGKKEGKRWKGMDGGKEEWLAVILVTMYGKL